MIPDDDLDRHIHSLTTLFPPLIPNYDACGHGDFASLLCAIFRKMRIDAHCPGHSLRRSLLTTTITTQSLSLLAKRDVSLHLF